MYNLSGTINTTLCITILDNFPAKSSICTGFPVEKQTYSHGHTFLKIISGGLLKHLYWFGKLKVTNTLISCFTNKQMASQLITQVFLASETHTVLHSSFLRECLGYYHRPQWAQLVMKAEVYT